MKKIPSSLLVTSLIFMLCANALYAGWVPMNMPGANTIHAFAQSGGNLFAGSQGGGVFLSTDNGASWAPKNSGLGDMNVYALAFQNTNLYAGTARGVYVSTDNGAIWQAAGAGLPADTIINCLLSSGSTLIAGTNGGFAFLSTNGGATWAKDTGLRVSYIYAFLQHDSIIYAGCSGGVYQSTDNGTTWKRDTIGGGYALAADGNNIYATGTQSILIYNGTRWTKDTSGLKGAYQGNAIWAKGDTILLGVAYNNILRSTDGGATWAAAMNGMPAGTIAYAFYSNGTTIFAGTSAGVYVSTNNGVLWSAANDGMTNPIANSICVNQNNGNIYAVTPSNIVETSTDNGTSWTALSSLPAIPCLRAGYTQEFSTFVRMSGNTVFVGTSTCLFSSTDNGATWIADTNGLSTYIARYCENFIVHDNKLFLTTYGSGIFRSTDNGASWQAASNGLTNFFVYGITQIGAALYAGSDGGVSVSTDDGTSWTTIDSGITDKYTWRLGSVGNTLFAGMAGNPYRMYISTNAGAFWKTDSAFPFAQFIEAFATFNGNMLAATEYNGIYLSTDSGASWAPANEGMTTLDFNDLAVSGNYVFAATGTSVWRRTIPDFTTKAPSTSLAPDSIFFTAQLQSASDTIVITNSGNATLIIDSVQTTDNLLTLSYQDSVPAGGKMNFIITCHDDTSTKGHTEHVGIFTNDPTYPFDLITVRIGAAAPKTSGISISPDSIFFLAEVKAKSDTVIIKNTGSGTLRIDSVHCSDNSFAFVHADSVAPGDSIQFIVIDLDTTMQAKTVSVVIFSNDPVHPVDTIKVTIQGQNAVAEGAIPASLWLSQNYPNPFSATTVISYSLPERENIALGIYNALGEKVAALASGVQTAGLHSAEFNATGLQNGMYFYRLAAGKYSLTGTMAVIK